MGSMPAPPVKLRNAVASDAEAISKLGARVFSETFGFSVTTQQLQAYLDESNSLEAVAADIANSAKDMIVATGADGTAIGFALLTRGSSESCITHLERTIELQRIYVDPASHGQGVGGILARELEKMARNQGYKNMWLGVWEDNHKAKKFYRHLSYQKIGDHDFVIGGVVQTDEIMFKEL